MQSKPGEDGKLNKEVDTIRIAHSPDSDDAFMFYALATEKVDTGGTRFSHVLEDIESLNRAAEEGQFEVSAVSIHAYAHLEERYALLNCGASMGEGYGPLLVSRSFQDVNETRGKKIAVPGEWTSAFLALKLCLPECRHTVVPFDQIIQAVQEEQVDAGVVIHEGQLSYRDLGLQKVIDLGEWWREETGLPLPLGGVVARRDLGIEKIQFIAEKIEESIRYALDHRQEALSYALQFGRGLDAHTGDRFVSMYVNERTLDYGEDGRQAVQLFLDRGHRIGLIPRPVQAQFVGAMV